jgi:hypothetical protein
VREEHREGGGESPRAEPVISPKTSFLSVVDRDRRDGAVKRQQIDERPPVWTHRQTRARREWTAQRGPCPPRPGGASRREQSVEQFHEQAGVLCGKAANPEATLILWAADLVPCDQAVAP